MARVAWTRIDDDDLEHVVAMLLCRENPAAQRIRPSKGDGGIDVLVPLAEEAGSAIYQVKSFSANLKAKQKSQIEESYTRLRAFASENDLKVSEWYLVLPLDGTHENHKWLADVTGVPQAYEQWRGLAFLDGLAAKYPDVIDYYLGNGKDRLQAAMQNLATAIGIGGFGRPADLTSGSSVTGLAAIHKTINESDPHYSYDFAVSSSKPPLPAEEENLVAAVQIEREQAWVTFKIFARCLEALRERPIPFSLAVDLKQAPAQLVEEFENFHKYGLVANAPAGTVDFETDLPGGLGGSFSGGSASLGPNRAPGSAPYQLRLRALTPNRQLIAEAHINMDAPTTGVVGRGLGASGIESQGVFSIRILTDVETGNMNVSVRAQDLTGLSPIDALPAMRFLAAFKSPNLLQAAQPHGVADLEPMEIPSTGGAIALEQLILDYVEALAEIQNVTSVQLEIPNFDLVTRRDAQEMIDAARMLRGEAVEFRWSRVPADVHKESPDVSTDPITLLLRQDLTVMVEGTPIYLGVKQTYFPSAVFDPDQSDLSAAKAVFVPFEDIPARVMLLREDSDDSIASDS